jgi:hypothetical protein
LLHATTVKSGAKANSASCDSETDREMSKGWSIIPLLAVNLAWPASLDLQQSAAAMDMRGSEPGDLRLGEMPCMLRR